MDVVFDKNQIKEIVLCVSWSKTIERLMSEVKGLDHKCCKANQKPTESTANISKLNLGKLAVQSNRAGEIGTVKCESLKGLFCARAR